jgi:hypothetical protein
MNLVDEDEFQLEIPTTLMFIIKTLFFCVVFTSSFFVMEHAMNLVIILIDQIKYCLMSLFLLFP